MPALTNNTAAMVEKSLRNRMHRLDFLLMTAAGRLTTAQCLSIRSHSAGSTIRRLVRGAKDRNMPQNDVVFAVLRAIHGLQACLE